VLLLDNIDWTFNEIWHIERRRKLINRLMAYTSVLVLGTALIGASVTVSARIRAALLTSAGLKLGVLARIGAWLFPLGSSFLAFLLMFLIIPATRVRLRSAALGALFSAVTWELGKHVFAASIGNSVRYSTLYGSLATIPIFLIWLYVTWVLVLVGLEIAYTHQNYGALVRRRRAETMTVRDRIALAVKIAAVASRRFAAGEPPPGEDDLAEEYGLEGGVVSRVIDQLQCSGLIRRTEDTSDARGFVPGKPLDRIAVTDVVRAVWGSTPTGRSDEGELAAEAERLIEAYDAGGREALGGITLQDLVDRERETQ
jgi:membrane protein